MRVIDNAMLDQISGGRGNNGGDRSDNGGRNNNKGGGLQLTMAGRPMALSAIHLPVWMPIVLQVLHWVL